MNTAVCSDHPGTGVGDSSCCDYRLLPLIALVERLCATSDSGALCEIHERPLFRFNGSGRIRMVEFIDGLRIHAARQDHRAAEVARDITIDRFSRLPASESVAAGHAKPRRASVDCRYYFRAFLRVMNGRHVPIMAGGSIADVEYVAAGILQRLLAKHFRLALLEARRNDMMTRYAWQLPRGRLNLLMPRTMTGNERRQWLERNVHDVNPEQEGEQPRVQHIINATIGKQVTISLDAQPRTAAAVATDFLPWGQMIRHAAGSLAETVATEKAAKVMEQRPAIRALGREGVFALVHRILSDLADGRYMPARIAHSFWLSKATLSRFAGIQWDLAGSNGSGIPDLWANMARVIGHNPEFIAVAEHFGVWPRVKTVLSRIDQPHEAKRES
jgi:hypothetical protein